MKKVRTAVLIHGYTLKAINATGNRNWRHVVFGNSDLHGRVPTGLRIAKEFAADLIIFGTGASCLVGDRVLSRKEFNGLSDQENYEVTWEAEFTWASALTDKNCFDLLPTIEPILETLSANTSEEIKNALTICARENITRLFLVTSPSHLPRYIMEVNKFRLPIIDVFGVACGTDFADEGEKTFITEPFSGGGEKPKLNLNQILPKVLKIRRESMPGFLDSLEDLMELYR